MAAEDLFPPIDPTETGRLKPDGRHAVYWEVSGNPAGRPTSAAPAARHRWASSPTTPRGT
jgi:hypothetical protein